MAIAKSAWGIDIGQRALKALKLCEIEGQVQVEAFEVIEYPQILSQPEVDRAGLLVEALRQFLDKNVVSGSILAASVPGQSSFTRFVKLPPVEPKRVPGIVRFEAEQQIPFPIEEVVWRWQTFHDPDSPDVEVGIFAMKRLDVNDMLGHLSVAGLSVDIVQMAQLALYNFLCGDQQLADGGATMLADVGTDKTELVVADGARIWTRTIQIGGSNFTDSLVRAFKLSFDKAENLKRTAASSKYARQIFQAMRPVFADLVQEIQRSIGYYTSLHREARFKRVVGMGNGFRLPGLQKFLEQNLNIPVARVDSYSRLVLSPSMSGPKFAEQVLSFGVAYGLALQGLDRAVVGTNLLPKEVARKRQWDRKRPWFAAAATSILLAVACWAFRSFADRTDPRTSGDLAQARSVITRLEALRNEERRLKGEGDKEIEEIHGDMKLYGYRNFWPSVLTMVSGSIQHQAVATDNPRLADYAEDRATEAQLERKVDLRSGRKLSDEDRKALEEQLNAVRERIADFRKTPRSARKVSVQEGLESVYHADVLTAAAAVKNREGRATRGTRPPTASPKPRRGKAAGPRTSTKRGFLVELGARTPLPLARANRLIREMISQSRQLAEQQSAFSIADCWIRDIYAVGTKVGAGSADRRAAAGAGRRRVEGIVGVDAGHYGRAGRAVGGGRSGPARPDPLLPDEDMSRDQRFVVCWVVVVEDDGVSLVRNPLESPDRPGR
jgi:type IV pilus assembly protein PilM